ncbi:MAG: pentapeptide repeat-containing protein [Thermomicrobiaceae bacterium]
MTYQWNSNPAFLYDRINTTMDDSVDAEIESLKSRPGYLLRLLNRMRGEREPRPVSVEHEPVCYAGHSFVRENFTRRRLSRGDFRGANLQRAVFTGATLDYSLFCDADLREANLAEAILTGADFRGANLSSANLIGADFTGADLRGANLQGAYIWGADFHDADLLGTLLNGAFAGGSMFSHARNLTLEQFRSTIHDETGAYRLSMLPDPPSKKSTRQE